LKKLSSKVEKTAMFINKPKTHQHLYS